MTEQEAVAGGVVASEAPVVDQPDINTTPSAVVPSAVALGPVTQVVVDNVTYHIGDHVYLESLNEAYYIGRIMEFRKQPPPSQPPTVPTALASSHFSANGNGSPEDPVSNLQVRVGWFYRAKDVPKYNWRKGKQSNNLDPHLLLATMHSDVNPVVSLRGHCNVKYILEIDHLETYRLGEDNFYFWLLYDRFTHTVYDVIRTSEVKHLPQAVLAAISPFRYILSESGRSADFSEVSRQCKICNGWVGSNPAQVSTCYTCVTHFHQSCLDADFRKRPGRGYVWNCRECLEKQAKEDEARYKLSGEPQRYLAPITTPLAEEDSDVMAGTQLDQTLMGDVKEPSASVLELAQMWPFRYLGMYWQEKAIDASIFDDDLIFPYARSRLGRNYQIEVPDEGPPESLANRSRVRARSNEADAHEQMIWSSATQLADETLADYMSKATALLSSSLATLLSFKEVEINASAKEHTSKARRSRKLTSSSQSSALVDSNEALPLPPAPVARDAYLDLALRALQIGENDPHKALELLEAAVQVKIKPSAEAVEEAIKPIVADFSAIVDNVSWSEEERRLFMLGIDKHGREPNLISSMIANKTRNQVIAYYYYWKTTPAYKQWKTFKKSLDDEDSDNEDEGVLEEITSKKRKSGETSVFRRLLSCRHCGFRFDPEKEGGRKAGPMKENLCKECLRSWKKYGEMRAVSDEERQRNNWIECVHVVDDASSSEAKKKKKLKDARHMAVVCAVCLDFEEADDNHMVICAECKMVVHQGCFGLNKIPPAGWTCPKCENEKNREYTTNYKCVLCPEVGGAMKLTLENNWVHIICAMWQPEVRFGDADLLEPAGCIGKVPKNRWTSECILCNKRDGACVVCSDRCCSKSFHVTCAQKQGLVMQPNFDRGKGKMAKLMVFCARHVPERLPMYEEPRSSLLRNFCRAFKRQGASGGSLRRTTATTLYDTCWCHIGGLPGKHKDAIHTGHAPNSRASRAPAQAATNHTTTTTAPASSAAAVAAVASSASSPLPSSSALASSAVESHEDNSDTAALLPATTMLDVNGTAQVGMETSSAPSEEEKPVAAAAPVFPVCNKCGTNYSPYWWPIEESSETICQECHWTAQNENGNDDDEEDEDEDEDDEDEGNQKENEHKDEIPAEDPSDALNEVVPMQTD